MCLFDGFWAAYVCVTTFGCRCLPPEIGCLSNLEYLDLSFNKMKSLPNEITYLKSLISLKVSNNRLVDLPLGLSCLQQLESLDLSNNRLMSLGSLELSSMLNLRSLNLQVLFWFKHLFIVSSFWSSVTAYALTIRALHILPNTSLLNVHYFSVANEYLS